MSVDARSPAPSRPGLLAAVSRLASSVSGLVHTHIELLTRELERERIRITRLALLGIGALFFAVMGVITLTLFVIVIFWDTHRLLAIGLVTLVYFAVGAGLGFVAKKEASRGGRPFSASVAALKRSREGMRSQPSAHQP